MAVTVSLAETSKFRADQYNLEFVATKSMRCRIYLHPTVPKENVVDLFYMCLDEFPEVLLIPHYNSIWRWL